MRRTPLFAIFASRSCAWAAGAAIARPVAIATRWMNCLVRRLSIMCFAPVVAFGQRCSSGRDGVKTGRCVAARLVDLRMTQARSLRWHSSRPKRAGRNLGQVRPTTPRPPHQQKRTCCTPRGTARRVRKSWMAGTRPAMTMGASHDDGGGRAESSRSASVGITRCPRPAWCRMQGAGSARSCGRPGRSTGRRRGRRSMIRPACLEARAG